VGSRYTSRCCGGLSPPVDALPTHHVHGSKPWRATRIACLKIGCPPPLAICSKNRSKSLREGVTDLQAYDPFSAPRLAPMDMVCWYGIGGRAQTATAPRNAPGTHDPPFLLHILPASSLRAPTRKPVTERVGRGFQVRFWVLWRSEPARRCPTTTPCPWEQALARYTDRMPENRLPPPLAIFSKNRSKSLREGVTDFQAYDPCSAPPLAPMGMGCP